MQQREHIGGEQPATCSAFGSVARPTFGPLIFLESGRNHVLEFLNFVMEC